MFLVTGPGHGAPAILASLWLEDSFCPYYPQITRTKEGFAKLVAGFSTPTGFPSHVSADVPGSIHEGGELG
jgi:xylulose-5-phosphate/fructose-6-phosphate phosphoketolase